ncbi:hypothetical protein CERSUDRAFT_118028 [Gelatoporia subvermispora B]|uniref:Uncharacterized protein n=1 Tax=Ceriporiopsis subvermispora (strain B) TaxID=914234 RepID=M2QMQ7_CERS8|nr:hypothetical protein CERSUDRAFT_118028 [Gelatoporia subvermispora B]
MPPRAKRQTPEPLRVSDGFGRTRTSPTTPEGREHTPRWSSPLPVLTPSPPASPVQASEDVFMLPPSSPLSSPPASPARVSEDVLMLPQSSPLSSPPPSPSSLSLSHAHQSLSSPLSSPPPSPIRPLSNHAPAPADIIAIPIRNTEDSAHEEQEMSIADEEMSESDSIASSVAPSAGTPARAMTPPLRVDLQTALSIARDYSAEQNGGRPLVLIMAPPPNSQYIPPSRIDAHTVPPDYEPMAGPWPSAGRQRDCPACAQTCALDDDPSVMYYAIADIARW